MFPSPYREISAHLPIANSGAEDGLAKAPLPDHLVHAIPLHSVFTRNVKRLPRPEIQSFVSSACLLRTGLRDRKAKTENGQNDKTQDKRSNSSLVASVHAAAVVLGV